jgi:hypothetical protein
MSTARKEFMMAKIDVQKIDGTHYRVRVTDASSQSSHEVALNEADRTKFGGQDILPEELIRRSFEFLLEREPKESILTRFDLSVISRYFPEFEAEMTRRWQH